MAVFEILAEHIDFEELARDRVDLAAPCAERAPVSAVFHDDENNCYFRVVIEPVKEPLP